MLVEVVCYSIEDVYRARQGGAHRVELCADRSAGGTTPSYGLIKQSCGLNNIDVMVMIRPRGGDFVYSREELDVMRADIQIAAELGAQGVVFGILDHTGFVDTLAMSSLTQLAQSLGLQITCHRAFDVARDPLDFLQVLLDLGINRLLTSGQADNAVKGLPLLRQLVEKAQGQLSIMPGGGVRPHNVQELLVLEISEIHTGSSIKVLSTAKPTTSKIRVGAVDDSIYHEFVDADAIRNILEAITNPGH